MYYTAELDNYKFAISEGKLTVSATLLTSEGEPTSIVKSSVIEGMDKDAVDASVTRLMSSIKSHIEHDHNVVQA
jgi:hypothetical protein